MGVFSFSAAASYDTADIGSNTNRRDVSEVLDLWQHKRTPFLNYLSWGPESGGIQYEWLYEHQGLGYVILSGELTASGATVVITTSNVGSVSEAVKQLTSGTMLMGWSSVQATHAILLVEDTSASGDIVMELIVADGTTTITVDAGEKLWIIGSCATEGSTPGADKARVRTQVTNNFTILRKDIRITGSMAATDMYAVDDNLQHEVRSRLVELQREREMTTLFSLGAKTAAVAASGTAIPHMRGVYSFLKTENLNIDATTTALTESAVNSLVRTMWDYGCQPNALFAAGSNIAKFTDWDRARVRTTPSEKLGGKFVTTYLTDIGIEIDLVPMPLFPPKFAFILDTGKIILHAKKGRKLLVEKLGLAGDYVQYQILSEFTVEVRGYQIGTTGGCFDRLA